MKKCKVCGNEIILPNKEESPKEYKKMKEYEELGFCSYEHLEKDYKESVNPALKRKIDPNAFTKTKCVIFNPDSDRYPAFFVGGKRKSASRYYFELVFKEKIEEGVRLLTVCGIKGCVNPYHKQKTDLNPSRRRRR